jgi:hypothetical protein
MADRVDLSDLEQRYPVLRGQTDLIEDDGFTFIERTCLSLHDHGLTANQIAVAFDITPAEVDGLIAQAKRTAAGQVDDLVAQLTHH